MPVPAMPRSSRARAVGDFLAEMSGRPSALVIEGEAGIGKTTVWLAGVDEALKREFLVLSARAVAAESVLAYGSLADLLDGIDPTAWANLPEPQRVAMNRVVLAEAIGPPSEPRALAAGLLAVIEAVARETPVLIAIDDLQWLDPSSAQAVASVARRLKGPVGVLATVRTESGSGASWLQMPRPQDITRIGVSPLSLGGVHEVVSDRLGRSFPRPTMLRIHQISGGNPFYALELARAVDDEPGAIDVRLPGTLADLVQARLGGLGPDVQEALLAAACASAPTMELVALATGRDLDDVVSLLESPEVNAVIEVVGHRLRFAHPLLARGVHSGANPARRRAMHRRLAVIVVEPELQARHLALAAATGDPVTLRSLDAAAEIARGRGAPAAAAELVELALALGGDTPERRMRSAQHTLAAGDSPRAVAILEALIDGMSPGPRRAEAMSLLGFAHIYNDSLVEAANCFERTLAEVGDDLATRVQTLCAWGYTLVGTGRIADARRAADEANADAERLGDPVLLSQALSAGVVIRCLQGEGYDEAAMQHALSLEDRDADGPVVLRPRLHYVMVLSWTGQLDRARAEMAAVRRRCAERGEEYELVVTSLWLCQLEIWRNDFLAAGLVAEESIERALLLGGNDMVHLAQINMCITAAYAGRVDETRIAGAESIAAWQRNGGLPFAAWGLACLGFLEVSLGNYEAALATLELLIVVQGMTPEANELYVAWFVPDAVEALIHVGRRAEAEPLIGQLERNGRRLDRAWMLAMGARGRAMLLAAEGNLDAASAMAQQAMVEHDRLPMPFERARTQVLVGQLQRRRRQKELAAATLNEALATFEELGTPLWAQRVRAELSRVNVAVAGGELTPSEQRVAELAASGMTNRDVAAAMFISPKTVEANLSRIYQKLNIRSRAELGRRMGDTDG